MLRSILQHLRRAGLVTTRREGKFIYYRLADEAVLRLVGGARTDRRTEPSLTSQQVMSRYFHDRDSFGAHLCAKSFASDCAPAQ